MAAGKASTSAQGTTADRELIFTRLFDAPRELVFEAWTNPQHLEQWWGPNGFTTTIYEMDVRPGGVWRLVMHGPDGRDYKNKLVYLEVKKPERLVYKHDPEKGSEPGNFEVTVTFDARGEKTEVTMRMLFPSAAQREFIVKTYGAIEGANETLGRLAEHLPKMAKDPAAQELVITRVFDARRELVFKAWTEPERLRRWWGPGGFTNPVCEFDPRPGGSIRIHMRAPDGTVYPMTGVVEEITAPERLVFLSSALDDNGNALFEVLTTVIFEEQEGKTTLTMRARVTKATPEAVRHIAGMEQGWSQSLDRLVKEVAA